MAGFWLLFKDRYRMAVSLWVNLTFLLSKSKAKADGAWKRFTRPIKIHSMPWNNLKRCSHTQSERILLASVQWVDTENCRVSHLMHGSPEWSKKNLHCRRGSYSHAECKERQSQTLDELIHWQRKVLVDMNMDDQRVNILITIDRKTSEGCPRIEVLFPVHWQSVVSYSSTMEGNPPLVCNFDELWILL